MAIVNPPAFLQNSTAHTAEITRAAIGSLMPGYSSTRGSLRASGGVHPDLGFVWVTVENGTPNMSVNVDTGIAYIPGSEGSKQGVYCVTNDAVVNLSVAASDPTLNRIDLVVVKVQDAVYSGATNTASLVIVTGTAASSPSPPAAPANSITLAQLAVNAGITTITNARITDKRPFIGIRGIIQCTSTTRPTWVDTDRGEGQIIFERDTDKFYGWNGTAWILFDVGTFGNRFVGETVNSSSNVTFTNTETAGPTVTATLVSTDRYMVMASGVWESSSSGDLIIARIRYKNAASLSTPPNTDTELVKKQIKAPGAGSPANISLVRGITGLSGQYTFGLTGVRSAGSGTCQFNGAAANNSDIVLDVLRVT